MKIVQISSLWESTPPPKYGGLELVASNLTEGLVAGGHEVTLFATGDSKTSGKLVGTYPRSLYRDGIAWTSVHDTLHHVAEAIRYAEEWGADVIHNHLSHRAFAMMSLTKIPFINTIHGTVDIEVLPEDVRRSFMAYKDQNFVSISDQQRTHATELNWIRTVYNGIDVEQFEYSDQPGDYLVWVGRITPTKAPHLAIEIAKKAGIKLVMAAKIDQGVAADVEYFKTMIEPQLSPGSVEFLGEVDHAGKVALYKGALAFVNPLQWDEPFGLVVTESMACGTPVITYNRGSMAELIEDGVTGRLIEPNNVEGMVAAIQQAQQLDRAACRQRVVDHFSSAAMVQGYLAAYQQAIG